MSQQQHNSAQTAKDIIHKEAKAIAKIADYINDINYNNIISCLYECTGRIIISGIGKSAIIAQKIVATFNSTGTPSLYMHAADAIHGDLGMITQNDIVIIISKSGESPEIKALIPLINNFGNKIIAITGNINSFLAKAADFVLDTTIDEEADPNNLAPTTSTTAQLVIGDTLAICLLQLRGFTAQDFAKYHPGGALGKRLYLTTGELAQKNAQPYVSSDDSFTDVLLNISTHRLGATVVIENGTIIGVITDGDVRRLLQNNKDIYNVIAKDLMTTNPKSIDYNALAVEALNIMRTKNITQLIVTKDEKYFGIIHLHDLITEGIL